MRNKTRLSRLVFSLFCFVGIMYGYAFDDWKIGTLAAIIGLGYFGIAPQTTMGNTEIDPRKLERRRRKTKAAEISDSAIDPNLLVEQMIEQGQVAVLLRPQIIGDLSDEFRESAIDTFDQTTSLIDPGHVMLIPFHGDEDSTNEPPIAVEAFFLDRFPVTNYDYLQFVLDGGYEQESLWEDEVIDVFGQFVDQTENPGPRFWKDGRYATGMSTHPVVGICWYEAMAYARWAGKRLPSDPEWVRAATSPMTMPDRRVVFRRYPWGDAMLDDAAVLWSSGSDGTVPVTHNKSGTSVADVHQLIGNVWEWMYNDFGSWNSSKHGLETEVPLKSIRGGAFDTYFDNQATGQFMSGDESLARKHNIGFRCAVAAKDLLTDEEYETQKARESKESHPELAGAPA